MDEPPPPGKENCWTAVWRFCRFGSVVLAFGRFDDPGGVLTGGVVALPAGSGIQGGQAIELTSPEIGSGRPQPALSGATMMSQPASEMADALPAPELFCS